MIMPTLYKAELTEPAPATVDIWKRMHDGLKPRAREILSFLRYYAARDLPLPSASDELTQQELRGLDPIACALMRAAIEAEGMPTGKLVATLQRVAKDPSLVDSDEFPADVLWEVASGYRRGEEQPGTFSIDVWGRGQVQAPYPVEIPTAANITRAAETALQRLQANRKRGRPFNHANQILAQEMSTIFRSSGRPLVRKHKDSVRRGKFIQLECGPFHDFLKLVLPPLNEYLSERRFASVTVDSIVCFSTQAQKHAQPARSPNFSLREAL
jgi:hypothetical protein